MAALRPGLVIHTVGPFQQQDFAVAQAAIAAGAHYCDLADARRFVCGIGALVLGMGIGALASTYKQALCAVHNPPLPWPC